MGTKAKVGLGTQIYITRATTGATRTKLAEIKDVEFPDATADEIDVTNMDSPGGAKEFIGGLVDNGECVVSMNWVPDSATDTLLLAIKETRETITIEFVLPGKTTGEKFAAFLKGYKRSAPVGEALSAEATFRISGAVA